MRARPADGLRRVRAIPVGAREREGAAERIDRRPVVLAVAVGELVRCVQPVVDADVVLALILRVVAVDDRVGRAQLEAGRRAAGYAFSIARPFALSRSGRDDVVRERLAGQRIRDDLRRG